MYSPTQYPREEELHYTKDFSVWSFVLNHSPLSQCLATIDMVSIYRFFFFSRILFERNVICGILALSSFILQEAFSIHQYCYINQLIIYFYCWITVAHWMDVPVFLSTQLMKDILIVSSFGRLWMKLLWTFVYEFFCEPFT